MKFLLVLSLLTSISAFAFPTAPFDALKVDVSQFSDMYLESADRNYDFEGIVKLSNCSGSVIRFSGQPLTTKAYVLTNGHCLGRPFLKPGQAVKNKEVTRSMRVFDKNMKLYNITAQKLVYGTMTGTDAAIYELKETYNDLLKVGIRAFFLDYYRPIVGVGIDVVSGYWDRGYRCSIDAFVYLLKEASWTFADSIRYSEPGCDTIGGTSGSPIIETNSRRVVGINNTSNVSGQSCTMDNPCEVDKSGNKVVIKGASYGQQTYQFYTCLTRDFKIDTNFPGCKLTK